MPLVSIIIPVYNNTRTELERCLESIQFQTFKDFELLVIDDGSEAVCGQIIEEVTRNIANCRIIHKVNEGVSASRNLGVQLAVGKYIAFVDADDVLQSCFLAEAVDFLQGEKADIVYGFVQLIQFEKNWVTAQDKYYLNRREQKKGIILSDKEKKELYCHMFDLLGSKFKQGNGYISRGPVARVLTKDLAVKCPFDTSLSLGEDAIWNLSLLQNNPKAGFVRSVWYLYCQKQNSASRNFNDSYKAKCTKMIEKYWEMAGDTPSKVACLRKVFEIIRILVIHYYLTEKFAAGGIRNAVRDLNQLLLQHPWNTILRYNIVKCAGWKEFLKFVLLETNLLLPAYAIKKSINK